MKKHYETHVEDTDKLISVAGPILEYKSWYEQYRKLKALMRYVLMVGYMIVIGMKYRSSMIIWLILIVLF